VRALWRRFTDRDLTVDASTGHLILGLGEFLAVLAVSKHLVREINLGLQSRLSRRTWVQIEWSDAHLVDAARTIHGDDPVLPVRAT